MPIAQKRPVRLSVLEAVLIAIGVFVGGLSVCVAAAALLVSVVK